MSKQESKRRPYMYKLTARERGGRWLRPDLQNRKRQAEGFEAKVCPGSLLKVEYGFRALNGHFQYAELDNFDSWINLTKEKCHESWTKITVN